MSAVTFHLVCHFFQFLRPCAMVIMKRKQIMPGARGPKSNIDFESLHYIYYEMEINYNKVNVFSTHPGIFTTTVPKPYRVARGTSRVRISYACLAILMTSR